MTAPLDQFAALSAMPVPLMSDSCLGASLTTWQARYPADRMDAALDDNVTDPELRRVRLAMRGL